MNRSDQHRPEANPPARFHLDDLAIVMERQPGMDPTGSSFELVIRGNGDVMYEERGLRPAASALIRTVGQNEIVKLLLLLFDINFFAMRDHYSGEVHIDVDIAGAVEIDRALPTDLPTLIFTVRMGDYEKNVTEYLGGPSALGRLKRRMIKLAGLQDAPRDF